jgi:histidinol phosphatase-like enzyme
VLKREILDLVSAVPCSLEQDVFPALVERGQIRGKAFDGYFLDIGLPETLEQGHRELPNVRVRPAALFDRRALMGGGEGDSGALQWTAGAVEAVRALNDRGYYVFVMSGASDGGRLNAAMQASLAAAGAHVDRFTGAAGFASGAEPGSARGPAGTPGAFAKAMDEWPIVREKSFFVGVASEGIEATRAAAITGEIFDGGDLARFVEGLLARPAQG